MPAAQDEISQPLVAGHMDGIVGRDLFGVEFLGAADDAGVKGSEEAVSFHSPKHSRREPVCSFAITECASHFPRTLSNAIRGRTGSLPT